TLTGAPSVPGAHSYPERYPLTIATRLPRGQVSARTPLADGNIAVFANRWQLIDVDTLPHYVALIRDDPEQARAVVATPIGVRLPHPPPPPAPPAAPAAAAPPLAPDIPRRSRPSLPRCGRAGTGGRRRGHDDRLDARADP